MLKILKYVQLVMYNLEKKNTHLRICVCLFRNMPKNVSIE